MHVPNRYRTLGQTGASVFEVGFGTWPIGGMNSGWGYGETDDTSSLRALSTSLHLGCNFFDTADCYGNGHSEKLLGQALRSQRSNVLIATKVGFDFYHGFSQQNYHPAYIRFAVHQSLKRLATDYIDLLQLHNPPPDALAQQEIQEVMEALRNEGKVRWLGVSAATVQEGVRALDAAWLQTIQVPFHLLAPEAEYLLFPIAVARNIGIIAREPLANGLLTGKYRNVTNFPPGDIRGSWPLEVLQAFTAGAESLRPYCREGESMAQLALRFVLQSRAVSVAICGCKTAEQVQENFKAP